VGDCDLAESCDGVSSTCPTDQFVSAGTACTDDGEVCTLDECDGAGACAHPAGNAGAECRAAVGECDVAESCDGVSGTCPTDAFVSAGTACGDGSSGQCDNPDTCDGAGACQDNHEPNGTPCDDGLYCNVTEDCQGGVCTGGEDRYCGEDPDDPCTIDTCDDVADECVHTEASSVTVTLDVDALGPGAGSNVSREVTFVITRCPGTTGDVDNVVKPVTFDENGEGAVTVAMSDVTNISRLRDASYIQANEGHVLSRRLTLDFTGTCDAPAAFTNTNTLVSGDFQTTFVAQDNLVDIVDFSILASRWNEEVGVDPGEEFETVCAGDTAAECSYGADATGDGIQDTSDFTAIKVNFFALGDEPHACAKNLPPAAPGSPPTPTSDLLLALRRPGEANPPPLAPGERSGLANRAPARPWIMPGDTVDVLLTVSQVPAALDGLQTAVQFDEEKLALLSITPGDGAGNPWDAAAEFYESVTGGTVAYACGLLFGGSADEGTVARLRFQALAPGEAVVYLHPALEHRATKLTADGSPIVPRLGPPAKIAIRTGLQPAPRRTAVEAAGG
jgi:hypothetical protein